LLTPAEQVTRRNAQNVVSALWPLFFHYATLDDEPGLLTIATPQVEEEMESNYVGCQCDLGLSDRYTALEVTAPPEKNYPISFLAEIDQIGEPDQPEVQLVIFERAGPVAPWMITTYASYGGTNHTVTPDLPFLTPVLDPPPSESSFEELAQLFQSLRETGSSPSGDIWDGTLADPKIEPGDLLRSLVDSWKLFSEAGVTTRARFEVTNLSPSFASIYGTLTCGNIR